MKTPQARSPLDMAVTGKFKVPRRDERYPVRVPIALKIGTKVRELFTGDVSFRGLFICTDTPPVLRQLISMEMDLPPDGSLFRSHGMSVYVLRPGQIDGKLPGVGVQFYAQSAEERRKWERFVTYVRDKELALPEGAVDPVKRKHPRIDARFEVHPRDLDELRVLFTRDISNGGMFLETDLQLDIGRTLALTIFHPISRHSFTIDSVVRRRSNEAPAGLGVEFMSMSEKRFEQFEAFVTDGLDALSELDDVIVEIDP